MKRHAELLLLAGSLVFVLLLGGAAELLVRSFSSIALLGNSKELFTANAFGKSHGNTPNVEAISFGRTVYTDEHGFRVPKGGLPDDVRKTQAILILGDSVGFGPAVEEPETVAGRLRVRFPAERVYNSSVIGYATPDYRNVVDVFVPEHPEVRAVVLLYCLNDVTSVGAQDIGRRLDENPSAPPANLTETLRSFRLLSDANDYLRSRSKLYLLIRHRLLRTQTRDWRAVLSLYDQANAADVERSARDLSAIAAALAQRGIRFAVILSPFEYQLRDPADPATLIPQRRIGEELARAGVSFVDPRASFDRDRRSTDYFLAHDSMHLSAEGHRVIANAIAEALER